MRPPIGRPPRPTSALKKKGTGSSRDLAVSFKAELEETTLPPVDVTRPSSKDALRPATSAKSAGPRLGAFLDVTKFSLDDYFRSQDAKMGLVEQYNPTPGRELWGSSHGGSPDSTPLSSSPLARSPHSSRASTPATSRPASAAASRPASAAGSRSPAPSRIDSSGALSRATSGSSSRSLESRSSRSSRVSRAGSGRHKTPEAASAFLQAKQRQAQRQAKEAARRKEQQELLLEQKRAEMQKHLFVLQARVRQRVYCEQVAFDDEPELFCFLNKQAVERIVAAGRSAVYRQRYVRKPYMSPELTMFFPTATNTTLGANWLCHRAQHYLDGKDFFEAHVMLKNALADLLERGAVPADTAEDSLITAAILSGGPKTRPTNPFCTVPGCSRRPVKVCDYDKESKICDVHQFPALLDRERGLVYSERHPMNVATCNRRDFFWLTLLCSTHPRLGQRAPIGELVLPKTGVHGADIKYGGNVMHLLESILTEAWAVTVPDDCSTVPEAVAQAKDGMVVRVRRGYHAWDAPIEVRTRLRVEGEPGSVLHGMWIMDEGSGGGEFDSLEMVGAGGRCVVLRGGKWLFDKLSPAQTRPWHRSLRARLDVCSPIARGHGPSACCFRIPRLLSCCFRIPRLLSWRWR